MKLNRLHCESLGDIIKKYTSKGLGVLGDKLNELGRKLEPQDKPISKKIDPKQQKIEPKHIDPQRREPVPERKPPSIQDNLLGEFDKLNSKAKYWPDVRALLIMAYKHHHGAMSGALRGNLGKQVRGYLADGKTDGLLSIIAGVEGLLPKDSTQIDNSNISDPHDVRIGIDRLEKHIADELQLYRIPLKKWQRFSVGSNNGYGNVRTVAIPGRQPGLVVKVLVPAYQDENGVPNAHNGTVLVTE